MVDNYYCYPHCPKGYEDLENRCRKPEAYKLDVFGNKKECEKNHKNCEGYKDDSIFTEECDPQYNKLFKTLCIGKCPAGYIDNGIDCEKRGVHYLGNLYTFDFKDLFI